MYRIHLVPAAFAARLRRLLAAPQADRGDSPVPSAIIIAGLVILAVVVVGWIYFLGSNFMDEAPTDLPEAPVAPGGGGN